MDGSTGLLSPAAQDYLFHSPLPAGLRCRNRPYSAGFNELPETLAEMQQSLDNCRTVASGYNKQA